MGNDELEVGPAAQSATDGMANTNAIVTALGVGTSYAAGLCDAYEVDSEGNTPCRAWKYLLRRLVFAFVSRDGAAFSAEHSTDFAKPRLR